MDRLNDLFYSSQKINNCLIILNGPGDLKLNLEISSWADKGRRVVEHISVELDKHPNLHKILVEHFQDQLRLYKKEMRELLDDDL